MNDDHLVTLLPSEFEGFLERYLRFVDGVIREFHLVWGGALNGSLSKAELVVEAMDAENDSRWSRVYFSAIEVADCYWSEGWHGTIENCDVILREFNGLTYLAVRGCYSGSNYSTPGSFSSQETRMFVSARRLLYSAVSLAVP